MGGEHARELITAEIAHWLGRLLTGTADEMGAWPAMAAATATARQHGWAKGSLAEWGDALLTHVVFKVRRIGCESGLGLFRFRLWPPRPRASTAGRRARWRSGATRC